MILLAEYIFLQETISPIQERGTLLAGRKKKKKMKGSKVRIEAKNKPLFHNFNPWRGEAMPHFTLFGKR